jgi:hypothetical protein
MRGGGGIRIRPMMGVCTWWFGYHLSGLFDIWYHHKRHFVPLFGGLINAHEMADLPLVRGKGQVLDKGEELAENR